MCAREGVKNSVETSFELCASKQSILGKETPQNAKTMQTLFTRALKFWCSVSQGAKAF